MPVPNDLTPEEEAAFVEHGVQPAGQGSEPVIEGDEGEGQQTEGEQTEGQQTEGQQTGERPRGPDGKFLPKDAGTGAAAEGEQTEGGEQTDAKSKMVPHEALHAERQRAAAAIQQAQLLQTRMNAMLAAQQSGKRPSEQELPNLAENPVGYIQAMEQRLARFEQEREQENQFREVDSALEQDEQLFAQSVPDYEQASDHYVKSRAQELLAFNTPQDAQKILQQEARQIANEAWKRGMSAGQMIYQLAQARGYQPGNTAADPTKSPLPPTRTGPTAKDVVNGVKAGQNASRSLSGGTGAAPAGSLNAEAILKMSDEEFEQYLEFDKKGVDARFAAIG